MCTVCVQMPSEARWGYPVPLEVELQTIVSCLMWPNKHFSFAHTEATNAPDLWDRACSLAAAHRYASPNGTCEKPPLSPTQGSAHGQTIAHTSAHLEWAIQEVESSMWVSDPLWAFGLDFLPGFCDQFSLLPRLSMSICSNLSATVSQSRNAIEQRSIPPPQQT